MSVRQTEKGTADARHGVPAIPPLAPVQIHVAVNLDRFK
jgi:hypothetical protein